MTGGGHGTGDSPRLTLRSSWKSRKDEPQLRIAEPRACRSN
jgi:hypothetical protein